MTLAALWALVKFVAANVATILGLTSTIATDVSGAAKESSPYRIQIDARNISDTVHDINWGLPNLHAQLTAIQAAIAALPDGTAPVVLPSPPAGYGGPSTGDIATDVWTYILPNGAESGAALGDIYGSAQTLLGLTGVRLPGYPWIVATSLDNWNDLDEESLFPPVRLDAATILPSDASILAWANRIGGAPYAWANHAWYGITLPAQIDQNSAKVRWYIDMTPAQFAGFQAVTHPAKVRPLWPGNGLVTFSSPVALADQLTITRTMDGVSIAIDTVPDRLSFWQFDDFRSYKNLGAISFFSDNFEQEHAQVIGFNEAIYTPTTMVRAAGVKIRLTGGVTGSVYPWTINP